MNAVPGLRSKMRRRGRDGPSHRYLAWKRAVRAVTKPLSPDVRFGWCERTGARLLIFTFVYVIILPRVETSAPTIGR